MTRLAPLLLCLVASRAAMALPQQQGSDAAATDDQPDYAYDEAAYADYYGDDDPNAGPAFICDEAHGAEPNGFFPDERQCDKYYICENGVSTPALCPDGLVFDISIRNHEKCVLPHNDPCGGRPLLQPPTRGIDAQCGRANGFFDHDVPGVCDKFYTCDKGKAHELSCSFPLIFDVDNGNCVRREQASRRAKRCDDAEALEAAQEAEDAIFSCPKKPDPLHRGLYGHPLKCQYYFSCIFQSKPVELGCPTSKSQVFDLETRTCKPAEDVPGCECTFDCEAADCDECNEDCSCGGFADEEGEGSKRRRK